MGKKFIRLSYMNVDKCYRTHKLKKGALVRYRFNQNTILSYHLDEEKWRVGIISNVNWYVFKPPLTSLVGDADSREQICYDLTVHQSDGTGTELINLESNEIFLLSD